MAKNQDPGSGINIPDPQHWYKLDSSLGRVPTCDAGDPGSIPVGGKLNVCLQLGSRDIINIIIPYIKLGLKLTGLIIHIMHLFLHPPTPPQVHNVESHNLLDI